MQQLAVIKNYKRFYKRNKADTDHRYRLFICGTIVVEKVKLYAL